MNATLACEQAFRALWRRGGKSKERLRLRLWNLNICIEKVEAKCWLAEMTLVLTSLPLARVFQCLFTFALVSSSRWLAEVWQLSRQGATGALEVEFKFQRRSCKLSFLFPPRRQSAPESLLADQLNIVRCYMLRPFGHPVACCCVLLGVVLQSMEPIKRSETMLEVFAPVCT